MLGLYAIFCADPLDGKSAEPDFAAEVTAARDAGFTPVLVDHDMLDRRVDPAAALRKTRITESGLAIYRGWMLRSAAYRKMHDALLERGVRLVTSPAAYDSCHHAVGSYANLSSFMPKTSWLEAERLDDPNAVASELARFGTSPVIIKDWVKSQASGYWAEACFIPDASDTEHASRVLARFRDLQGDDLVGGVVFKAYVPLLPVGAPAHEYRAFIVGGRVVGCWPRSSEASKLSGPPAELLSAVADGVPSPFASADFGVDGEGRWWLLEVGDGQVSGLPSADVAQPLFQQLSKVGSNSGAA